MARSRPEGEAMLELQGSWHQPPPDFMKHPLWPNIAIRCTGRVHGVAPVVAPSFCDQSASPSLLPGLLFTQRRSP